jgi:hypothetical protein
MDTTETSPQLAAALLYGALGWPVVPLFTPTDGVCDCPQSWKDADKCTPGKHPRTRNGLDDASTDEAAIRRWWGMWPHANIGVDLARAGLVDIAPDSLEWFAEFTARGLPKTLSFASGGGEGHAHHLYARPEGCAIHRNCQTGKYDVMSNGYAVMPPSLHSSGRRYTWLEPADGVVLHTAQVGAPDWGQAMLTHRPRTAPSAHERDEDAPPVTLSSDGLERWYGRLYETKPDGSVDRSYSLWWLAVFLLEAGCRAPFVEDLLAERDLALGWGKFSQRDDAIERYSVIVERALESQGPGRVRLNGKPAQPKPEPPVASGFTFTSLEDLLAEPPEEVAYLVDGLLPSGGVSLWGAKPKVGKSVAVRNLALAVARGEMFLERACHRGGVVVLALEEKRAEVANHFRQLGGIDELVHIHVGAAPTNSKEGMAALRNAITLYQPVLVIADPVLKLVRVRDSSDYAELTRELEPVIELARTTGCHIAVTHHLGKMAREGGDDVLGSTAIFGAVDTLVLMRRRKDNQRVLQSIQRYGTDLAETLVPMDAETGHIALGAELSHIKLVEAQTKVLALFERLPDGESLDQKAVREQADVDSGLAYRALQDLLADGRLQRGGAGKRGDAYRYWLTGRDPEKVVFLFSSTSNEKQENNKTESLFENETDPRVGEQGSTSENNKNGAEELPW